MIATNFDTYQKNFIEDCCKDICEQPSLQISPHSPSTYPQLDLKQSYSFAETCEEDFSVRGSQQGQYSQKHSLEISRFSLDCNDNEIREQLCEQFHEQGFCFKGKKCEKIHLIEKDHEEIQQRRIYILNWILKETPQLLLQDIQGFDC